jgi:hypothetical protein
LGDTCLEITTDTTSVRQGINTTISPEYAEAINQNLSFSIGNIPAVQALLENFLVGDDRVPQGVRFQGPTSPVNSSIFDQQKARAKTLSTILATTVTDGMARIAGNGFSPFSPPILLLPNRTANGMLQGKWIVTTLRTGIDDSLNVTKIEDLHLLHLNPTFQRYGYGYRWSGSRTAQFGISILLVHTIIATLYTIFVIFKIVGKGPGIGRAWESMPELFVLAMNSRPTQKLNNTCAGISRRETWCENVGVRAVDEGHLEIVFGRKELEEATLISPEVLYGTLPHPTEA